MNKQFKPVRLNLFDRAVCAMNPKAGAERIKARAALSYLEDSGYIVAGGSRRSVRGWKASANSPEVDVLPKLEAARASSRDLYMNTALASGALKRVVTNAVGSGLTFQSRIDRDFLGLSEEEATAWERTVEREFALWATSKDCDAARTLNFYEMQRLAFLSTLMNGDSFVLLPYLSNSKLPYNLRVQLVEADVVTNPSNALDTERCAGGIEVDDYGAPKFIHVRKSTGMDVPIGTVWNYGTSWTKVPFFGEQSGRRNVLHLFEPDRIRQRRAMPYLAPVFEKLKQLTRLSDAELMANIIASFFTVIIKSGLNAPAIPEGFIPEEQVTDASTNPGDAKLYEMAHGNFIQLDEGDDVSFADPNRPSKNYEPFFNAIVKEIGCALEQPFEVIMLIFNSSYSASRAALQEAWKFYFQRRTWLARNFNQPIYEEFLTEGIMNGRISAPGYFDDPLYKMAWSGASWNGIKMGSLDPLKETKARILKLQYRLSNYEDEYVSEVGSGEDWESSVDRLARQEAYLKSKDLATGPTAGVERRGEPGTEEKEVDETETEEPVDAI